MSTIFNIIFFIIIILNVIYAFDETSEITPKKDEDYPDIKCGKKNPKKYEDCTKYGTDSGMLCCWISSGEYETNDAECVLLSHIMADKKGINGKKTFIQGDNKRFWACGNNVDYLNLRFIYLFYILLFLV